MIRRSIKYHGDWFFFHRLLFPVLLLAISGCSGINNSYVQKIIINSTCAAPCWNEIVPGQTTKKAAIDILGTLPDQGGGEVTILPEHIRWISKDGIYVYFKINDDSLIETIRFRADSLSIEEAFEVFGDPSHFVVSKIRERNYVLYLIYSGTGILLRTGGQISIDGINLSANQEIDDVIFTNSESLLELMTTLFGEEYGPLFLEEVRPWAHFGNIYP